MNPLIEQLRTQIYEDGISPQRLEHLAHLMECAKIAQADAKAEEDALKEIWLDAYLRGEVEKTVTVNGIKVSCSDAGEPKTTTIPAHYVPNVDHLMEAYPPRENPDPDFWLYVAKSESTTPGKKAGVSVTLPKA